MNEQDINAGPEKLQPLNESIRAVVGSDINPSTSWRWVTRGFAGLNGERIKLQVTSVGRTPYTTQAAVRQWLADVTEARLARMARTQQRANDVTDDELKAVGLTVPA
jgi:hypothetical protein